MFGPNEPGAIARRSLLRVTGIALLVMAAVAPARAADSAVTIDNFTFTPQTLTVPKGTTVIWTNRDDIPHVVLLTAAKARSPVLDTGESYSFTFAQPGTFAYYCALHPHMQGSVVVTG